MFTPHFIELGSVTQKKEWGNHAHTETEGWFHNTEFILLKKKR
jgi:hypothetical protein